jgi:5,10-methylene-tetrahydrofolate dehydrogenase/methenyl tetrahydrofolate cyclohydrolase
VFVGTGGSLDTPLLRGHASQLKDRLGRAPGLAVVIVGERKDSQTYVRNKVKACNECGIASTKLELPESVTQDELVEHVRTLNADALIDGILVQLPLPCERRETMPMTARCVLTPTAFVHSTHH